MYNWRYHIATLVAVFLALAVGLLLGTVVVERGVLNAQRTTLVEAIQKDLNKVRSTNTTLKTHNDALGAFATDAAPQLMKGALDGRTVVVLADPGSSEVAARASEIIRTAGGTPLVATFSSPGFGLSDPTSASEASRALGVPVDGLDGRVAQALSREWTTSGGLRPVTTALLKAGALTMSGLATDTIVAGTVVTAVYASVPDTGALELAKMMATPARPAVAVEMAGRGNGQVQAGTQAGLSAVDDISSPLGAVSLVWILGTRASGHFGESEGAVAPFPEPLFGQ